MADQGFRVFVIDDDEVVREMLAVLLEDACKVTTFSSAEDYLARAAEGSPDMFLLDVTMPGMNGFDLCRRLKDDFDTQDIPVTFVSANDDLDSRLAAYEAGGEDFIVKPFDPLELQNKVKVAQRLIAEKHSLREQAGFAQRTALSAMTSMGELGVVLQFLSKSFACGSSEELGREMLAALQQYDLQGAVQLRLGAEEINLSPNGVNIPLEVGILTHVRASGRIFQFKTRAAFNYGGVTVMLNNLPLDDPDKVGRIRDNVAILAEGADARLQAIGVERENRRRQQGVVEALPQVHDALESLQDSYRRTSFHLTQHMIEFQEALMKSFVHLGLTEGQEDFLNRLANEHMQRIVAAQDQNLTVVDQLRQVADQLGTLAG
ncbi:MAG TPA: response regulator [Rhodocyclaceae bacterium]|nr:response regulator [Rhodocyclaceae bacterium]HMW78065.1 response regulator [Rhodocyclaceae bacterium]HNM22426.1 response regulator [Rhodocyclaceae bacterium]